MNLICESEDFKSLQMTLLKATAVAFTCLHPHHWEAAVIGGHQFAYQFAIVYLSA